MAYPTVDVAGNTYDVYGTLEDADIYLAASTTAGTWGGFSEDQKGQCMVSAVRWLETLNWLGSKTDTNQELAWPRKEISGVSSSTIPIKIQRGMFELSAALADDPELFTAINDPNIRLIRAGPVEVDWFRPLNVQWLGVVPKAVLALIGEYLVSANTAGGPIATDVSGKNPLEEPFDFNHGI